MALAVPPNAPLVSPLSAAPGRLFTAADLERFTAEGLRYELIEGVLSEMTPPGGEHGGTTMSLSAFMTVFIYSERLGRCFTAETGFLLARKPDTVMAPDFAFVSNARLSGPNPRGACTASKLYRLHQMRFQSRTPF